MQIIIKSAKSMLDAGVIIKNNREQQSDLVKDYLLYYDVSLFIFPSKV